MRFSIILALLAACRSSGSMQSGGDDAMMLVEPSYLSQGDARKFELTYVAQVKDIPAGTKLLRVWFPVPQDSSVQKISGLKIEGPHQINIEPKYGNKVAYVEVQNPPASWETKMTFTCVRHEIKTNLDLLKEDGKDAEGSYAVFRGNDTLTFVDDRIRKMAADITKGKRTAVDKARAIYDYVTAKMTYDKNHQGWGRGDVNHACDVGKGNCTDFHALFQALCRASGIASGFEIGLYLPYTKDSKAPLGGYHCWAFFRVPGKSWVPVDCSEACTQPKLRDYFFGNHTSNRVTLSTGRDLVLNPAQEGDPLNYFLNAYAEADGVPVKGATKSWSFRDLE